MDTADSTHLHAPGVGFVLKQYYKPPFSLNAPVRKYHLGIFTSLTHAQEAAQHALQCILSKLIDEGYHGRYCKDIDLKLRVLITVYADIVVNGYLITQENWLSELQMGTIEVWDPSWDAERTVGGNAMYQGYKADRKAVSRETKASREAACLAEIHNTQV
ncbi:hypothetical protein CFE70_003292 [Pyrenophora teres f. teres 0-1]